MIKASFLSLVSKLKFFLEPIELCIHLANYYILSIRPINNLPKSNPN